MSNIREFFSSFIKSKGGLPALVISTLLSFGIATTVGIVPVVLSDRYARLYHGYTGQPCSNYEQISRPHACMEGGDDAQTGSAWMALVQNLLIFIFNPVVGSQSDVHGRRGFLIGAIFLFCLSPVVLVMMQKIPWLDPFWYYAAYSSTGLISYMSLIFAALSDCTSEKFRAASFAIIMAGFYSGFSLAPSLVLLMTHEQASCLACILCLAAFTFACQCFPETLPESVAEIAVIHHAARFHNASDNTIDIYDNICDNVADSTLAEVELEATIGSAATHDLLEDREILLTSTTPLLHVEHENSHAENNEDCNARHHSGCPHCSVLHRATGIISRPFGEMAILSRSKFLRLVTLASFLSATVYATDASLVVYYIEEHLNVRDVDIAEMFFVMGILGVALQALGLQPLVQCLGERGLLIFSFICGTCHNFIYGAARSKKVITLALSISQLTKLNYPILSSLASKGVLPDEQGQIQGALLATNALAGAVGPVSMNLIYEHTKDGRFGPGVMFLLASFLYFLGSLAVCFIPFREIGVSSNSSSSSSSSSSANSMTSPDHQSDNSISTSEIFPENASPENATVNQESHQPLL